MVAREGTCPVRTTYRALSAKPLCFGESFVKFIMPSRRKLERFVGWIIVILVCLAVPYTHGTLQYLGLIVVAILLFGLILVISRWVPAKKTSESTSVVGLDETSNNTAPRQDR
jgi:hypothetical protein